MVFKKYGFTLLELLLVTIIILALVSISTPLFRNTYEDLKLTSTARDMASIIRLCYEKAVFERQPYRLKIDTDNNSYRIFTESEEDGEFKPLRDRWGRTFRTGNSIVISTEQEDIDFSPGGYTSSSYIYLTNREGNVATISIEANTGSAKIYDYKKE